MKSILIPISLIFVFCSRNEQSPPFEQINSNTSKTFSAFKANIDTVEVDRIEINGLKWLGNKSEIIHKLGIPDSVTTYTNEIEEIKESIFHYGINQLFVSDDHLERFQIKDSGLYLTKLDSIGVGINCKKLVSQSRNPCLGEQTFDYVSQDSISVKTFLISYNGNLVDSYLDFVFRDSIINSIELR